MPYAVKFNAENIRTGVVPGDVEMCNGVSLYIANSKKTEEMVADLFKTADEDSNEQTNTENTNTLSK